MRCWRYLRGPGNVIHALLDYCIPYSLYIFYIILHFIFECACIVRYPAVTIRYIGVSGSCRISGIRPDIRFLLSGIIRYPTIRQIYYPVLSGIRLSGKLTIRPNPRFMIMILFWRNVFFLLFCHILNIARQFGYLRQNLTLNFLTGHLIWLSFFCPIWQLILAIVVLLAHFLYFLKLLIRIVILFILNCLNQLCQLGVHGNPQIRIVDVFRFFAIVPINLSELFYQFVLIVGTVCRRI